MSWSELNDIGAAPSDAEKEAAALEQSKVVTDFVLAFTSEAGRRVLQYLRANTIERPTFVQPGMGSDGLAMQKLQDMREGENNLVRRIERMLKQGGVNT